MFGDHVEFRAVSVFDLNLPADLTGTVIYCDPPYGGTTGYKTGRFDAAKAWELYRAWSERGAHVYVSEYSGPESFLVDTWSPHGSMGSDQRNRRVTEKLFYIPPTREDGMTKPNPFRPEAAEVGGTVATSSQTFTSSGNRSTDGWGTVVVELAPT